MKIKLSILSDWQLSLFTIVMLLLMILNMNGQNDQWQPVDKDMYYKDFKKMRQWFTSTPSYSFKVVFSTYTDYYTQKPFESMKGYFIKDGQNYVSVMLGRKIIQNANYRVVIDTSSQRIMITDTMRIFPIFQYSEDQELALLDKASAISLRTQKEIKTYRFRFPSNGMYEAIEISINTKGLPIKISYYYASFKAKDYDDITPSGEAKEKLYHPRSEIVIRDYSDGHCSIGESELEKDKLKYNKEKNIFYTDGAWKNFEIQDYRRSKKL